MRDPKLEALLNYDGLAEAEKEFGRTARSQDIALIGMLNMHNVGDLKHQELTARDDTTYQNSMVENYMRICKDLGFEVVLTVPFVTGDTHHDPGRKETCYILATRDGLLLRFDTWRGDQVNSSNFYYNFLWDRTNDDHHYLTSSGGVYGTEERPVWVGNHDGREALRYKVNCLRTGATLLAPWEHSPFLWLLHYGDTAVEGYDYRAINRERIALLPAWVQAMIVTKEGR